MEYQDKPTKREPVDPYDCWCMPCIECVYYDGKCNHPEVYKP